MHVMGFDGLVVGIGIQVLEKGVGVRGSDLNVDCFGCMIRLPGFKII